MRSQGRRRTDSVRLRKALEAAGVGARLRTGDLAVSAKRQINPVVAAESQFSWLKFSTYYLAVPRLRAPRRAAPQHGEGAHLRFRGKRAPLPPALVPRACDARARGRAAARLPRPATRRARPGDVRGRRAVVVAPGALRLRGRDRRDRGGLARRSESAQHSRPRDRLGAGARSLSRAHRACRPRHRRGHGRRQEFHPRSRSPPARSSTYRAASSARWRLPSWRSAAAGSA